MVYDFGNTAELRLGYQISYIANSWVMGDQSAFSKSRGRYGAAKLSYTYDRLDDEIVPHAGLLAQVNGRFIDANPGTKEHFPGLDGAVSLFQSLTKSSTVFETVEGGTIFGHTNTGVPLFFLGGPNRLSGYGSNELYGNEYRLSRIGFLKQIKAPVPVTDGRVYFVTEYEVAKMYDDANSSRLPMDVTGGVLVRTIFGPLFAGGSTGDAGHRKWFFQLGRLF